MNISLNIIGVVSLLLAPLAALHAADTPKIAALPQPTATALPTGFGAEVNPTGQPIGGGAGYTAGPKRGDATRHVHTLDELKQALADAKAGDVIWIGAYAWHLIYIAEVLTRE